MASLPPGLRASRRPWSLTVASGMTLLSAVVFAAVGGVAMLGGHGVFSVGVGVMLVIYALLVAGVGLAAGRGHSWSLGALVASSLLHLLVAIDIARARPLLALFIVIPVSVLATAIAPASRRALAGSPAGD